MLEVGPGSRPPADPPVDPPRDGNFTHGQIAAQLTDGYREAEGGSRVHFDARPGDILYVNREALAPDGAELAREALDAWSAVSG